VPAESSGVTTMGSPLRRRTRTMPPPVRVEYMRCRPRTPLDVRWYQALGACRRKVDSHVRGKPFESFQDLLFVKYNDIQHTL
jgi:hypothetical protein